MSESTQLNDKNPADGRSDSNGEFDLMNILGIKVVTSPYCQQIVSVRQHKQRRNQSLAYHRRIQKKWTKRFGTRTEKVAYMISGSALRPDRMVVHPDHMAMLRDMGSNDLT